MAGYRALCGAVGALLLLVGAALFFAFFRYHAPGGAPPAGFELGPHGVYFAAFAGSALVAWGTALLGAARRPAGARALGTATALGLSLLATYRIAAWVLGDYAAFGHLLRVEAAVLLLLALGFVWLRPPRAAAGVA